MNLDIILNNFDSIAIIISVVALCINWKTLKIEENREKDRLREQKAASFRAEILNGKKLVITNRGCGEARNIKVLLDGDAFQNHEISCEGDIFPEQLVLGAGASYPVLVGIHSGQKAYSYLITITWTDDTRTDPNKPGIYKTHLTC